MYIRRKVFSILTDEMGEERLYSVNETLLEGYEYDEEKKFSKRDLIDEDFLEEHEQRKKADRRGAKVGLTVLGGSLGFIPGAAFGPKGALVGAAAGAGLGYLGGKKVGKKSDERYDKLRRRYESASKKEKEYLRHKIEKELDRRNATEAAITAGYLAGR